MSLLAACQEERPALSLEQARKVTADFSGQTFKPPPRTISDVTAILDRYKPDPARTEAFRRQAGEPPPPALAGADLAQFYLERGVAAEEIGRLDKAIADTMKARELWSSIDRTEYHRATNQLIGQYFSAGRLMVGYRLRRIAVAEREKEQGGIGRRITGYANTARIAMKLGDVTEAQRLLDNAQELFDRATSRRRAPQAVDNWRSRIVRARGEFFYETGHAMKAEAEFRRSLQLTADFLAQIRKNPELAGAPRVYNLLDRQSNERLRLARVLVKQGRLVEAEIESRRALTEHLSRHGRYHNETAHALTSLALVLLAQGRYPEAQRLASVTSDIFRSLGHAPTSQRWNSVRRLEAQAAALRGNHAEALKLYDRMAADLRAEPAIYELNLARNGGYGEALLRGGRIDQALTVMRHRVAVTAQRYGDKNYATAEAKGYLATALARKGRNAEALKLFREAIAVLQARSRRPAEEGDGSNMDRRRRFILEGYLRLLSDMMTTAGISGDVATETFHIAETIRGQSVQRALAAASARAAAANPDLADLVRRAQDASKQVAALQGILTGALSASPDQQDAASIKSLRTTIDTLRSARAAIREEIERRFPDYVSFIDPRPATVDQVRKALGGQEALIATYVADDRTYVWAMRRTGPVAFAAARTGSAAIAATVTRLRRALDPNAGTLGDIPAFDVESAHRLYTTLLKPVDAGWSGARNLLVVAHGALGQLPFSVLVTGPEQPRPETEGKALFAGYRAVPFLARRVAVTQLPSVTSLVALRRLPAPDPKRRPFVGFGDPWFSEAQAAKAEKSQTVSVAMATRGDAGLLATRGLRLVRRSAPATGTVDSAELAMLPRLPDTAAEVAAVAGALGGDPARDVILGRAANEQTVRSMTLSDRRVVMFATHGLVPGDLNGLTQPALALSGPKVGRFDGDGLLTMDEIVALRLDADWVVLSACNTAAGDGAGAEAVSGLGRAFFYAGTRALLVSNWPVETTSARALTTDIFRRQAADPALGRAEALRRAMTGLMDGPGRVDDQGRTVFSYAHPIFWAPFSIVGDGAGTRPES